MAFGSVFLVLTVLAFIQSSIQTEIIKCQRSEKHVEAEQSCARKIAGSNDPDAMNKAREIKEMKDRIKECVFTTMEIVSENEFHADRFEKIVNNIETTDEIKNQLLLIMKECLAKNDKSKIKEIMECVGTGAEKVCPSKRRLEQYEAKSTKQGLSLRSADVKNSTHVPS